MNDKSILLIGSGTMAQDYVKVLQSLNSKFTVIGRGRESAFRFETATGIKPVIGGIRQFVSQNNPNDCQKAIVATGTEMLREVTLLLAQWGVKEILVEKPGGMTMEEVQTLGEEIDKYGTNVFVAYNRRFYASVQELCRLVNEDGGITSFNFEFTEWAHVIDPLKKAPGVKENWLFANSTHVIDLAFYLGGKPVQMSSFTAGSLNWHKVAIFAGAGITSSGALFSYQANWQAPGRWGIELLTSKHRFYLRPLEKLQVQKLGSIQVEPVEIMDAVDISFKPGLYKQTDAFVNNNFEKLVNLFEHIENCKYYKQIMTTSIFS